MLYDGEKNEKKNKPRYVAFVQRNVIEFDIFTVVIVHEVRVMCVLYIS